MRHWWFTLLVVMGCGAAVDDEPAAEEQAEPAAEVVEPAERVIPTCPSSQPQSPELCQQLRYGDRGYCNAWVDCAPL